MNKGSIQLIILAVVAVALLGGGAYVYTQMQSAPKEEQTQKEDNQAKDEKSGTMLTSIQELMMKAVPYTCTYTQTDETGTHTGTAYITGGNKIRVDFESDVDGGAYNGHMIQDGSFVYTWSDEDKQGVKIELSSDENVLSARDIDTSADFGAQAASMFDVSEEMNLNCTPWMVNNDLFKAPEDVTFMDMSSGLDLDMNLDFAPAGADCSMCNDIPDAAMQQQCKQALGCS